MSFLTFVRMSWLRVLNYLNLAGCLAGLAFMVSLCVIHYQKDETVTSFRHVLFSYICPME